MRFWMCMVMLTLGCAGKKPIQVTQEQARAEVEQAWNRKVPFVLQARFNITIHGPETEGTTIGAMIMHHPNRLRMEVQTPLQTPMLLLASDGQALNLWLHRDGVFLKGEDALQVLEEVTGGVVGLEDVLVLLSAGLPMPGSEISEAEWSDDLVRVRLKGSEEVHIEALIDPKLDTLRSLEVWRDVPNMESEAEVLLRVEIPDLMHLGRHRLPEEMTIDLPSLGWGLELEVHTWDELGVIPDVFELNPPAGAQIMDLVETVKSLGESQGVHPPE